MLRRAGAAIGVIAAILTSGLSWPTLLVALGFPLYVISRRTFRVDSIGAQFLELTALLPFTAVVWSTSPSFDTLARTPNLILGLLLLGLVSAGGFTLYLAASRLLPFALFGVLSYAEPVLLVIVSLTVLDERWTTADALTYLLICAGLAILGAEARRASATAVRAPVTSESTTPVFKR